MIKGIKLNALKKPLKNLESSKTGIRKKIVILERYKAFIAKKYRTENNTVFKTGFLTVYTAK